MSREALKEKEELQKKADELREKRDRANAHFKELLARRAEIISRIESKYAEADRLRERRNALNLEVKKMKEEAEALERDLRASLDAFDALKSKKLPKTGPTMGELKRRIRDMEFRQMTQVLTPAKERELLKEIANLRAQLNEREKTIAEDEELKKADDEVKAAREKFNQMQDKLHKVADESQDYHDKMRRAYRDGDKEQMILRKLEREIDEVKINADKIHEEYVKIVNRIDELNAAIASARREGAAARAEEAKEEAEKIFEKFKKGEKLTTEDLMVLQKAGLL